MNEISDDEDVEVQEDQPIDWSKFDGPEIKEENLGKV